VTLRSEQRDVLAFGERQVSGDLVALVGGNGAGKHRRMRARHGQLAVCGDVAAGEESAPGNPFCFRSFTPHWEQVGRSSTHED
jgi:ABC-type hemin transport system ATPase subunit